MLHGDKYRKWVAGIAKGKHPEYVQLVQSLQVEIEAGRIETVQKARYWLSQVAAPGKTDK